MTTTSAQDELAYIRKIMTDSRAAIADDGKPSIVWGIIVSLGMLFNYYEVVTNSSDLSGWVWLGLCICGWAYIIYYVKVQVKRERVQSFAGRISGALWFAVGITIALFVASTIISQSIDSTFRLHPVYICAVTAMLLAIGYFLTGMLYEISWLRFVGIGWWVSSLYFMFFPGREALLIYALLMIALQVVPGIMLLRKYKQAQHKRSEGF